MPNYETLLTVWAIVTLGPPMLAGKVLVGALVGWWGAGCPVTDDYGARTDAAKACARWGAR